MQQEQRKDRRRRSGQISGVQVMFAAILSIGLILAINFSARIADGQPLQQAYHRVDAEIQSLKTRQAELTGERDYVLSDAYVEKWARSDGKMVRPGEVLVVPVPSGLDIEVTPEPTISPEQVRTTDAQPQPWTLWWQMFFDSPPPNLPGSGN
jgi:cell division protein FtsB